MSNVNTLLSQRLQKNEGTSKMAEMARQSASGNLTSFSGVFSISELNEQEKASLETILKSYATGDADLAADLRSLISITSEVKAINNQAALLHGERIKKAHAILTRYRDGAFTAWLLAAYGNRQTPYNFMQYYDFLEAMPKALRPRIEAMPRQAVYTLASREAPLEMKRQIIENYKGETKTELLIKIREAFPLALEDKRRPDAGAAAIQALEKLCRLLHNGHLNLQKAQKKRIHDLLDTLRGMVDKV